MKASSPNMSSESRFKSHDTHQKNIKLTRPTTKAWGRKLKSKKASERLKVTKRWDAIFRADRAFFDQPFLHSMMQERITMDDPLGALLGEPSPEISRHEIERVRAYFQRSRNESFCAWLSYEPTVITRHAERVTAEELASSLSTSFASHREHRNQYKAMYAQSSNQMHQADSAMTRTLINPDSAYLLALIATVGWHQVRALRNVLVHYVMSKTDIEIYIPTVCHT